MDEAAHKRANPTKGMVGMEIRRRTCCTDSQHPFVCGSNGGDGWARTQPLSPYRASFLDVLLGMSSGRGISLAFKAFRVCAFECSGARSIYQGCCFALPRLLCFRAPAIANLTLPVSSEQEEEK